MVKPLIFKHNLHNDQLTQAAQYPKNKKTECKVLRKLKGNMLLSIWNCCYGQILLFCVWFID